MQHYTKVCKALQNYTKLYEAIQLPVLHKTMHNYTQLQSRITIQNCEKILYKTAQNVQNCAKLYKTVQNYAKLYNTTKSCDTKQILNKNMQYLYCRCPLNTPNIHFTSNIDFNWAESHISRKILK